MKIALASDLHHEFHKKPPNLNPTNTDILVLAGDIQTVKSHCTSWWNNLSQQYKQIIYIRGNHEYYKTYYSEFPELEFPDNVIVVGRYPKTFVLEGKQWLAGTMWTDLSNPLHSYYARGNMNDYRLIKYSRADYQFTPWHTTKEWKAFQAMLDAYHPEVVVSHHLPSYGSVHPQYKNDVLNCAYATEMDTSGVKLWMHGHTHHPCDWMKGDTRIVCNPKGYPKEEDPDYEPKVIEI